MSKRNFNLLAEEIQIYNKSIESNVFSIYIGRCYNNSNTNDTNTTTAAATTAAATTNYSYATSAELMDCYFSKQCRAAEIIAVLRSLIYCIIN